MPRAEFKKIMIPTKKWRAKRRTLSKKAISRKRRKMNQKGGGPYEQLDKDRKAKARKILMRERMRDLDQLY